MANGINNQYEYRSRLLDSLKVQHTASDVRNEDEYRKKVLNGLGVEYTEDDINQKNLYRAKVVEGLASSGGGGGSSDFSTAEVTVVNNRSDNKVGVAGCCVFSLDGIQASMANIPCDTRGTYAYECILYKGKALVDVTYAEGVTMAYAGDIEVRSDSGYDSCLITGDCTITIEEEK